MCFSIIVDFYRPDSAKKIGDREHGRQRVMSCTCTHMPAVSGNSAMDDPSSSAACAFVPSCTFVPSWIAAIMMSTCWARA
jgi:hypothetical protein